MGSAVGVAVSVGPAGADDGGADDGGAVAVGLGVTAGLVGAVGDGLAVAVAVAEAELVVGAGAGVPEQPESVNRRQTPRTLTAENPGLVVMPP